MKHNSIALQRTPLKSQEVEIDEVRPWHPSRYVFW